MRDFFFLHIRLDAADTEHARCVRRTPLDTPGASARRVGSFSPVGPTFPGGEGLAITPPRLCPGATALAAP